MNAQHPSISSAVRASRVVLLLACACLVTGIHPSAAAQNGATAGQSRPDTGITARPGEAPEKHTWKIDQLIPLTVAQAWQLSGRNEDRFFDMVQDLAAFSARNRHLVLPESRAAGQQAGEYIKQHAKADPQQLLYEVVDGAVRQVGKPEGGQTAP